MMMMIFMCTLLCDLHRDANGLNLRQYHVMGRKTGLWNAQYIYKSCVLLAPGIDTVSIDPATPEGDRCDQSEMDYEGEREGEGL